MKLRNLFMLLMAILVMSSCGGKKGDKEIEKQFVGTWSMNTSMTEDGITMELTGTITYNEDNTFEQNSVITCPEFGYGASMTIKLKGTWYATKDKIIEVTDKESIELSFSDRSLDFTEMSEAEAGEEYLSNLTSEDLNTEGKIINLGKEEIELEEDGEAYTIHRVK